MERDGTVLDIPERGSSDWTWPPYAPVAAAEYAFDTERWAPATSVRYPWLRIGRWTLLYRRAASHTAPCCTPGARPAKGGRSGRTRPRIQ